MMPLSMEETPPAPPSTGMGSSARSCARSRLPSSVAHGRSDCQPLRFRGNACCCAICLIGDDSEALPRAPLALRWPTHPAPLGAVLLRARVGRHCRRVGVLRQLPCPGRARSPKESRAREHVRRRRRQHLHTKWTASQLDAPGFCVAPAFSGISAGDAAAILLSVRAPLRAAAHSRCAEHVEPGNLTFLCQFALQGIPALKIALKMMEDASFPPR